MLLTRSRKSKLGLAAAATVASLVFPQLAIAIAGPATNRPATESATKSTRVGFDAEIRAGAVTLDQAVAQAEKRYSARVVKAESKQEDGKTIYELRLLSEDGRVWTIRVDASTGAVL